MARDVFIAIMRASGRGEGIRLSASEAWEVASAVATQGLQAVSVEVCDRLHLHENPGRPWDKVDPVKDRIRPGQHRGIDGSEA